VHLCAGWRDLDNPPTHFNPPAPVVRILATLTRDPALKSATVMMAYFEKVGGQAIVNGFDVDKEAEAIKQTSGYMAQQFGLYGDLTVDEYMHLVCDAMSWGIRATNQRTDQLHGTGRFSQQTWGALSEGMQKSCRWPRP
jgi:ABC-type Na+ transport system ATPase subunit NatA